jgi:hypothetical protein
MLRSRKLIDLACAAAVALPLIGSGPAAFAEDRLLKEAVNFNGVITYLATKVPGYLLVAVRNGETAIAGFGDIADKRGKTPDGDTMFRTAPSARYFAARRSPAWRSTASCISKIGCRIDSAMTCNCPSETATRSGSSIS